MLNKNHTKNKKAYLLKTATKTHTLIEEFSVKTGEWTISTKMTRQTEIGKGIKGSPEIPDRRMSSDVTGLPLGSKVEQNCRVSNWILTSCASDKWSIKNPKRRSYRKESRQHMETLPPQGVFQGACCVCRRRKRSRWWWGNWGCPTPSQKSVCWKRSPSPAPSSRQPTWSWGSSNLIACMVNGDLFCFFVAYHCGEFVRIMCIYPLQYRFAPSFLLLFLMLGFYCCFAQCGTRRTYTSQVLKNCSCWKNTNLNFHLCVCSLLALCACDPMCVCVYVIMCIQVFYHALYENFHKFLCLFIYHWFVYIYIFAHHMFFFKL